MFKHKQSTRNQTSPTQGRAFFHTAFYLGAPAGAALIALAVFFAYRPSMTGGFLLDDDLILTENSNIKAADGPYRFWCTYRELDYWPLTYSIFWIEWRLWGMNSTCYHVTGLLLHILETLLIWIILRRLSIPGAFLAALIFALHPVNVESVAWIAELKNATAMLFFLLSILWYLKGSGLGAADRKQGTGDKCQGAGKLTYHPSSFYWLSLTMYVLAMLSKGSAAVLPAILLGIIWWLRPLNRRDLAWITPFFLVGGILAWVNVWFQTRGEDIVLRTASFTERLAGAGCMPWFYLYQAMFPIDLCFVYPMWKIHTDSISWWLPLAASLAITLILWIYRKGWSRPLLFAWGFFCVALLPAAGFADVGFMRFSLVADRYQHIAIIGVIALVSAGWNIWRRVGRDRIGRIAAFAAALAAGCLGLLTWRQCGIYADKITLFHAALLKNPDCCMMHNNLGQELAFAANSNAARDEAIYHYRQAVRLDPKYAQAYTNLGALLFTVGHTAEGEEHLRLALSMKPDAPDAHNNLGTLLFQTGRLSEAEEHLRQAVRLKANYAGAQRNLGDLLLKTGRAQEASEYYERAVREKPEFIEALSNLASAYARLGRSNEAISTAQKALETARTQGRIDLAQKIEEWLKLYRAGLSGQGGGVPH
jgi:protein O-mannosyl-transferase